MVEDVLAEASRRGLLQRSRREGKDGKPRFSYQLAPALVIPRAEAPVVQRQLADVEQEYAAASAEVARLREEVRRIEKTGKTPEGKPSKDSISERRNLVTAEREMDRLASLMREISARTDAEPAPTVEPTTAPRADAQGAELSAQQGRAREAAAPYGPQISGLKSRLSEALKAVLGGARERQTDVDTLRSQVNDAQAQREIARSAELRGETARVPNEITTRPASRTLHEISVPASTGLG
jgi:hypothetical protein